MTSHISRDHPQSQATTATGGGTYYSHAAAPGLPGRPIRTYTEDEFDAAVALVIMFQRPPRQDELRPRNISKPLSGPWIPQGVRNTHLRHREEVSARFDSANAALSPR